MIRAEKIIIRNKEFLRTYSDEGFMIERDGVLYSEAIDLIEMNREYTETIEKIENELKFSEADRVYKNYEKEYEQNLSE